MLPPYPIPPGPMPCMHPALEIRYAPGSGRGVYAIQEIQQGVLLEISPLLVSPVPPEKSKDGRHGWETVLSEYTYSITLQGRRMRALALGLGSLFNHADPPNVDYRIDLAGGSIAYRTTRAIAVGEELCIYYGSDTRWMSTGQDNLQAETREDEDEENDVFSIRLD